MRVALAAFGSRGDHQPHLVLARAIQSAGHDVTVICHETEREWIASFGLETVGFPVPSSDELPWLSEQWKTGSQSEQDAAVRGLVDAYGDLALDSLIEAFATHDVVVVGMLMLATALVIRQRYPRPVVAMHLAPTVGTLRFDSNFALGSRSLAGRIDGIRRAAQQWDLVQRPVGLAAAKLGVRHPNRARQFKDLVLVSQFTAVSRYIAPAFGPDHPRFPTTGFLLHDSGDELTGSLHEFLAAGEPPIYIGLGSAHDGSHVVIGGLVDAAVAGGRRVITAQQDAWDSDRFDPAVVHLVGSTPHEKLFPHCGLVVHVGGSGTTGTALAAGVPQFVTPMAADQPYFGRRVHELGVAAAPVPFDLVRGGDVLRAARFAERPSVRTAAARLGALVAEEDGVGNALRRVLRAGAGSL